MSSQNTGPGVCAYVTCLLAGYLWKLVEIDGSRSHSSRWGCFCIVCHLWDARHCVVLLPFLMGALGRNSWEDGSLQEGHAQHSHLAVQQSNQLDKVLSDRHKLFPAPLYTAQTRQAELPILAESSFSQNVLFICSESWAGWPGGAWAAAPFSTPAGCKSWAGCACNMPHFIYLKMVPQLPFNHLSSLAL